MKSSSESSKKIDHPMDIPKIPFKGHFSLDKSEKRREWVETHFSHTKLPHISQWWDSQEISVENLKNNIENPIGLVKIPLGIAGPLLVRGRHFEGLALCPMATTEGALVASVTRGCNLLNQAGGVHCKVIEQRMCRAPYFLCTDTDQLFRLEKFINDEIGGLDFFQSQIVAKISRFAKLVELEYISIGRALHIRFVYETGDAAGQNMTTSCTWACVRYILKQSSKRPDLRILYYGLEGSLASDKKPSKLLKHKTRGIRVLAEAKIPEHLLQQILHTDRKTWINGMTAAREAAEYAGMFGFNINVSNMIAAVFAATGQDIACVSESCIAELKFYEIEPSKDFPEGGIHFILELPSLIIGTVGGGTGLPTQKECLNILGCHGEGKVFKFAEIIAGFCLALDLSTAGALASHQFAAAHDKLGRNRPDSGFQKHHFNTPLFEVIVQGMGRQFKLHRVEPMKLDYSESILTELSYNIKSKLIGIFGFDIYVSDKDNEETENPLSVPAIRKKSCAIKIKASDKEVIFSMNQMASGFNKELAILHSRFKLKTGFRNCHLREIQVIRHSEDPRFLNIIPRVYASTINEKKEIYMYAMEFLHSENGFSHLQTVSEAPSIWKDEDIQIVLKDLASFHSLHLHYGKALPTSLKHLASVLEIENQDNFNEISSLWNVVINQLSTEFPNLFTEKRSCLLKSILHGLQSTVSFIDGTNERTPRTLIHNDFNPRNICLRRFSLENECTKLCVYDWELATVFPPQRDLAEFLAFTLPPTATKERIFNYINTYIKHFEYSKQRENILVNERSQLFNAEFFYDIFGVCLAHFMTSRLLMYGIAHVYKDYDFYSRLVDSCFNIIQHFPAAIQPSSFETCGDNKFLISSFCNNNLSQRAFSASKL